MIRSRRLQNFLSFASAHTDGGAWRVLHEGVRQLYLGPGIRFFRYAFRPKSLGSEEFSLFARHSATVGNDFNAFQSDLDMTVVLPDSKIEAANDVVKSFFSWKSRLPFIGELEIYSRTEFEELQKLLEGEENIYSFIRRIRKLSWMEESSSRAPSDYHRMKAKRSISKVLAHERIVYSKHEFDYRVLFSNTVQKWLEKHFKVTLGREESTPPVSFLSHYLATSINSGECKNPKPGELGLPPHHAVLLLALTPVTGFEIPELNQRINRLRLEKSVREQWLRISRIECLIFQAVLRAQASISEADRSWLQGFIDSWKLAQGSS